MSNFREASKGHYTAENTIEHINAGSLQRIADATEKVATNYDALLRGKKSAEEGRDYWQQEARRLGRRIVSLRGYITRLKRR